MKCFSTLEDKFRVSARPRNMLYLFLESSIRKLKTKLDVISSCHEVVRSHFVK